VGHPDGLVDFRQERISFGEADFSQTVLMFPGAADLATKRKRERLHAVADAQDGQIPIKQRAWQTRSVLFVR